MAFTFFFRDLQTLNLVAEHVIPSLKGRMHIDIWDAGCAMGPEPYTLAIILRENMGQFLFRNVRLFATDLDEQDQFGNIINQGCYHYESLKRIPTPIREKYFAPLQESEGPHRIRDDLRKAVIFEKHDLLSLKPIRSDLGMIICKNVLLHFNPVKRVEVIKMFHDSLAKDGFLVTEHTQKMPEETEHLFEPLLPNAKIFRKVSGHA